MCDNCGTAQGPFTKQYGFSVCKNLKGQTHKENGCTCRVTQCVERRNKKDFDKYDRVRKEY